MIRAAAWGCDMARYTAEDLIASIDDMTAPRLTHYVELQVLRPVIADGGATFREVDHARARLLHWMMAPLVVAMWRFQISRSLRVTPVSAPSTKTTALAEGMSERVSSGSAPTALSPGVSRMLRP